MRARINGDHLLVWPEVGDERILSAAADKIGRSRRCSAGASMCSTWRCGQQGERRQSRSYGIHSTPPFVLDSDISPNFAYFNEVTCI
jgi:hypothetical protein